ncbi:hypothetical protein ACRYGZ_04915 [Mycobacteroides abscessus]
MFGGAAQRLGAVAGGIHLESGEAQAAFQRGEHVGVVVHHQYARGALPINHACHLAR